MAEMFPALVYLLCLVTSTICAALLIRSYMSNPARLLLWSATCFALLALNNLVVVIDILAVPKLDLRLGRLLLSLAAVGVLLFVEPYGSRGRFEPRTDV